MADERGLEELRRVRHPLLEGAIKQATRESLDGRKVIKTGIAVLMSLAEEKLPPEKVGRLKDELENDLRRLVEQSGNNQIEP